MEWIVEAEDIGELLNGRFTVQTKPLVMCKDCKYSEGIAFSCQHVNWWNHENDYCSKGERRADG